MLQPEEAHGQAYVFVIRQTRSYGSYTLTVSYLQQKLGNNELSRNPI